MLMVIKSLITSSGGGGLIPVKQLRKCASNLLSRYFREELKQRERGRGLLQEGPIRSYSVTRS